MPRGIVNQSSVSTNSQALKTLTTEYNHRSIEHNIQAKWLENNSFCVEVDDTKDKYYCLSMFPYPSGRLHMGHVRNYTISDVISRFQRMLGKNVLHPIGWDSFGMPAENAAIQNKKPPAEWTYHNIDFMRQCLQGFGFSFNWDREIYTCKPDYYQHQQQLFIELYKKGIAYRKKAQVNWCETDQTVLANEQVIDGNCWRCNQPVQSKLMEQWFVRITDKAEQLIKDLETIDWPKEVKQMQKKWIGQSKGMQIVFPLQSKVQDIEQIQVFTTRVDTLFGVSFIALSIDHPIVKQIAKLHNNIAKYIATEQQQSTKEADFSNKEKSGIDLGIFALHPITKKPLPIFVANFVLQGYGEGAVMAVPAHDQRDFEFATKYRLPILPVIEGSPQSLTEAYTEKGRTINSGQFNQLAFKDACQQIGDHLVQHNLGYFKTQYRLRDWNVSRQRYWGTPIPMVKNANGQYSPSKSIPVILPENLIPNGAHSPLIDKQDWCETTSDGTILQRDCDTFDTFVDSSWYFVRFVSPKAHTIVDTNMAKYWLPVDQYVGGIEHAVLHLMYARYIYKILSELGLVPDKEPFKRLLCQGMVLAESYYSKTSDDHIIWHHPSAVDVSNVGNQKLATLKATGESVAIGGMTKMSKSKNNGIDPMPYLEQYGADAIRLFMMFAAPPEQTIEWSDSALHGSHRFLSKLHATFLDYLQLPQIAPNVSDSDELTIKLHQTIAKVRDDYQRRQTFNTVVSAIMELYNSIKKHLTHLPYQSKLVDDCLQNLLLMLQPIAPHLTSHLWQVIGCAGDIQLQPFPQANPDYLQTKSCQYVVQVNGKIRGRIDDIRDLSKEDLVAKTQQNPQIQHFLADKAIIKIIYIPNRLLNFVVK